MCSNGGNEIYSIFSPFTFPFSQCFKHHLFYLFVCLFVYMPVFCFIIIINFSTLYVSFNINIWCIYFFSYKLIILLAKKKMFCGKKEINNPVCVCVYLLLAYYCSSRYKTGIFIFFFAFLSSLVIHLSIHSFYITGQFTWSSISMCACFMVVVENKTKTKKTPKFKSQN